MAEQLYYTWTRRGREGGSGFQIVAASPGLTDESARLTRAALRSCRYDGPPGATEATAPISFGWADEAGVRVVFHRVMSGLVLNTPGAFCAHLVIGPVAELPLAKTLPR